jgi:hypothetical protein
MKTSQTVKNKNKTKYHNKVLTKHQRLSQRLKLIIEKTQLIKPSKMLKVIKKKLRMIKLLIWSKLIKSFKKKQNQK